MSNTDKPHHWLQLMLVAEQSSAEQLGDQLSEAGALAVTLQDSADEPIYEPALGSEPLWSQTRVIGLFDANTDVTLILEQLRKSLQLSQAPDCLIKRLDDQDWERVWMDQFKPMRFGERLWICPSAYTPPEPDAVNIILDPGLAFGTGTHPTTALCLEWLDQNSVKDKQVIDYGCGSGILAVAAAKLGARTVQATDIDTQALYATHENAKKNSVAKKILTALPEQFTTTPADCLLANILANPLRELAPRFASLCKPSGRLVLSGILSEQASAVEAAYQAWFNQLQIKERDGWVCIHGIRNTHD